MKRLILAAITAAVAITLIACDTNAGGGYVAITFDDGPFPHTPVLLDILAEHQVTATFFVIGNNVNNNRVHAEAIFAAGHELANHSWTHPGAGLGGMTADQVRDELTRTSDIIAEITGEVPVFFRAPNLDNGGSVLSIAGELGMAVINADQISEDWNPLTPEQIAANVSGATNGSIILLHEQWGAGTTRTKEALPIIIRDLRSRGLEPVSLGELVRRQGRTLTPGTVYNRIN